MFDSTRKDAGEPGISCTGYVEAGLCAPANGNERGYDVFVHKLNKPQVAGMFT